MVQRIARFQNCYGPEGTWTGGREKAPAAICRKVAEVDDGGTIEVWGDGTAIRCNTYVSDMVAGILRLTLSDLDVPVNVGSPERVTVNELVAIVADVAGESVNIKHVEGPVGGSNLPRKVGHFWDGINKVLPKLSNITEKLPSKSAAAYM